MCLLVPSVSPSPSNGNTPSQPKWNSGKPLRPPPPVPKPVNGMYPGLSPGDSSPHEYERLINLAPIRPAPRPPGVAVSSYATLATYNGLEGVPFVLGSGFQNLSDTKPLPVIKAKTKYDLDKEIMTDIYIKLDSFTCDLVKLFVKLKPAFEVPCVLNLPELCSTAAIGGK
uniref:Uncharacterized protein n=1 Tax=Timema bartmani TaxID=61472 RepID=A0A7R9F4C1_9NEOP|nr:unnamed protein product [Timema bartmani]